MAEKRDGVANGWLLFKAWCETNGGTPIRGGSSAEHVCFVGPLPDDTIDPGDEGTVDVSSPGSGISAELLEGMVAFEKRAAELRLEEAKLNYNMTIERIKRFERNAKGGTAK